MVAPELPSEDVDAGAAEYARVVIDALEPADDAIVVGHSLGGMTVPLVPARLHVYLCAYVPQPGRALIDRGPEAPGPRFADSAILDELERSYWPDPAAAAHDLQYPAENASLAGRLRRQARKPSVEPSPLAAYPDTPCAYIVCTDDPAVPPEWQRAVARGELGVEPIELSSGHSPMLTCPAELAEILDRKPRMLGCWFQLPGEPTRPLQPAVGNRVDPAHRAVVPGQEACDPRRLDRLATLARPVTLEPREIAGRRGRGDRGSRAGVRAAVCPSASSCRTRRLVMRSGFRRVK